MKTSDIIFLILMLLMIAVVLPLTNTMKLINRATMIGTTVMYRGGKAYNNFNW